ncbi:MAG: nucleoid-associated protein, YbaB/EbfC family [Candidatus Buchananbacteria bacterium RIFCSPHIGHO2_02_FULL_40_13]|uniref:Nucleoid-associated protein A3A02_00065 n=1 Tax=Candidatus Buchananbacteria bacterium RIFCSPLOWO2_01_FULL_39_33 TaxID=1797543 RepID=A0A1G1YL65_9BACT|nr:MAG: nucleoid-associated protein, YbaB/EbfC family [Candidatus Buchananbacteria bacterium RIFCSPHIGHO2_01_FULL_40_35]OGY50116.1 MAG: nucleoid-associated protein, YbaB/EbfC family [Candidatus Buchananbacteria bacterium RIFCSPHIGHO2_02_FULL_40_13]OGY53098.1 MAG: nucleoid-associated protein, YbaB/EbfC family [Candidatus Buchananbacteria bacterium RIFCSPLOWO2_01_FULL_39_33]
MFNKLKQIQELKSQANQIKKALSAETVEGSGGWGKIKITMDGNQEIKKVEINDELLKDKVKLESAVLEAANDAIKKVQRVMAQKMSQFGGLSGL